MSQWTNEELQQVLSEVARRATVDSDFRKLAISSGAKAIAAITPKLLPAGFDFTFVDNSGTTKTIPLPDLISGMPGELSETELAYAAGGVTKPTLPVNLGLTSPPTTT